MTNLSISSWASLSKICESEHYSDLRLLFDCQKVTLFVFNKRLHEELFDHITEEKQRYLHTVPFNDSMTVERTKLLAISRSEDELCRELIYPSIIKIHKDALRKKE